MLKQTIIGYRGRRCRRCWFRIIGGLNLALYHRSAYTRNDKNIAVRVWFGVPIYGYTFCLKNNSKTLDPPRVGPDVIFARLSICQSDSPLDMLILNGDSMCWMTVCVRLYMKFVHLQLRRINRSNIAVLLGVVISLQ